MGILLQFLREYSWVLYIVSALGFMYFVLVGVTSMRDMNRAVFGMERSSVNARAGSAWVRAVLCLVLAGAVFVASNLIGAQSAATQVNNIIANVAPTPAAGIVLLPTSVPTADFLAGQNAAAAPVITPTFIIQPAKPQAAAAEATPFPETPTADSASVVVGTPTQAVLPTLPSITLVPTSAVINAALPTAAPVATATPRTNANSTNAVPTLEIIRVPPTATPRPQPTAEPVAALPPPDCADPYTVGITSPQHGQNVNMQFAVTGNAGIDPNGGYAKLEVLLANGGWGFLARIDVPTKEGSLGNVNLSALGPGVHQIRLMTVDHNQRENIYCRISIRVAG
jgi:hypothetical protein